MIQQIVDNVIAITKESVKTITYESLNNVVKFINGVSALLLAILPGKAKMLEGIQGWELRPTFRGPRLSRWMGNGVSSFNQLIHELSVNSDTSSVDYSSAEEDSDGYASCESPESQSSPVPGTGAAHEVGTMGAEGYCVNVPWSRGRVGDNDYIFAFQNVVLPIAHEFTPDFTIISAGFDAARGDPLGGCDVTPAGYACMTHMLSTLSSGKMLVILEGGYNLRSISSSATAVIKVLLGDKPECQFENVAPSASGLQTLLEVMKLQTNFWPCLNSNFTQLQSCWELYLSGRKKPKKRRLRMVASPPTWWRFGRKRFLYYLHSQRLRMKP